jgi:hypothetical protein
MYSFHEHNSMVLIIQKSVKTVEHVGNIWIQEGRIDWRLDKIA